MFKPTAAKTPADYIAMIDDPVRRAEVVKVDKLIRKTLPKQKPHIQSGMIGYGTYHYKSPSGREGDWFVVGLSSRKDYISVYVCAVDPKGGYLPEAQKANLGKASVGKSCIRFKQLADLNEKVLTKLLKDSEKFTK